MSKTDNPKGKKPTPKGKKKEVKGKEAKASVKQEEKVKAKKEVKGKEVKVKASVKQEEKVKAKKEVKGKAKPKKKRMKPKKFRVTGNFMMGAVLQKFEKEVEASGERRAREKIFQDLGSKHRVKRSRVLITAVEEAK